MIDVIDNFLVSKVSLLLPEEKVITTAYLKIFSTNTLERSGLINILTLHNVHDFSYTVEKGTSTTSEGLIVT